MSEWPRSLILVGAGKMGGAMLKGWLEGGLSPGAVALLDPDPSRDIAGLAAERGLALNPPLVGLAPPDVLVLAVKPQVFESAALAAAPLASARTLVMSIMAGKTIANLHARLREARAIVRAMPNTPAAIGRGATAAYPNPEVSAQQRQWAERMLSAVGAFHWLASESALDAVTAISGGGPAYVFALTEALAEAAQKLGLPQELAMSLARATVEGAGELMAREPQTTPAILRKNVTSPGGTTAEALKILQGENGLSELMARATAAACRRSAELAG